MHGKKYKTGLSVITVRYSGMRDSSAHNHELLHSMA
jgi:hypothetical protein